MKRNIYLILYFFYLSQVAINGQSELTKYSFKQDSSFYSDYQKASDEFAKHNYKTQYLLQNGQLIQLIKLQNNRPLFYTTHNAQTADFIELDNSYQSSDWHPGFSGNNICIGIWDGGHVLNTHSEFTENSISRIKLENETVSYQDHSTHVGGTIAAFGTNSAAKGMAYQSELYSRNYLNDLSEMASEAGKHQSFVSNHSYGPLAGWLYNSEEAVWYWYGDININSEEDYAFGFYGTLTESIDELAYLAPFYLMVVSAGNDRNTAPPYQPISHKVWTYKWVNSNVVRDMDGGNNGYDCIGMNGAAKNVITVGAIDGHNEDAMTIFSAWGPTDDGRIKPDITAPGIGIYSSTANSDQSYDQYSGTSMAAACISGALGILQELQAYFCPDIPLLSSTLKGILIHTADDKGNIGPDYQYGWGTVNFAKAHLLLEDNITSGGACIKEYILNKNTTQEYSVHLSDNGTLKATIVWTDIKGDAEKPSLNSPTIKLVNDLDISIEYIGNNTLFSPWILDPLAPQNAATKGVNIRDNVEQVVIENALAGDYIIRINGTKILSETQTVSLLISGHDYTTGLLPPKKLNGFYATDGIQLNWEAPEAVETYKYQIYRNGLFIGSTFENSFIDSDIDFLNTYTYQVSASYSTSENSYSLPTNTLTIKSLPVVDYIFEEYFETSPQFWTFANNEYGWRWGDLSSLNSYYLNFEGNTSMFMGISSDALGNGEHVSDCLISVPFRLPANKKFTLNFNYFFNNDAYNTSDLLELVYRSNIHQEWNTIGSIPSNDGWNPYQFQIELPDDEDIIQLGFLYDDLEKWGFGAGIDNIKITESTLNTVIKVHSDDYLTYYVDKDKMLHLRLTNNDNNILSSIEIFDITGKKVIGQHKEFTAKSELQIPLSDLPQGIYILSVQTSISHFAKAFILY